MVKYQHQAQNGNRNGLPSNGPKIVELKFILRERHDAGHKGEFQWVSEVVSEVGTTLYFVPSTAPVVPQNEDITYRCEVGKTVFNGKDGFRIVMVRILESVIRIGDRFDNVRFEYGRLNSGNMSEKCKWRGSKTVAGGVQLTFWANIEQLDLLGQAVPGNNPICEVKLEKLIDQSPDGRRRIYGVRLLRVQGAKPYPETEGYDRTTSDLESKKPEVLKSLTDLVSVEPTKGDSESGSQENIPGDGVAVDPVVAVGNARLKPPRPGGKKDRKAAEEAAAAAAQAAEQAKNAKKKGSGKNRKPKKLPYGQNPGDTVEGESAAPAPVESVTQTATAS